MKIKTTTVVYFIVFIVSIPLLMSFSSSEYISYHGEKYQSGNTIAVEGYIAQVGDNLFAHYVIIDDDNTRFILPDDFVESNNLIGKSLQLIAILHLETITSVKDGRKTIIRHLQPIEYTILI